MLYLSAIYKLAVLDISTGLILGLVRQVVFDHRSRHLAGIGFSRWAWDRRKYVTRSEIQGIGDHALTIASSSVAKTLTEHSHLEQLVKDNIPSLDAYVITTSGKLLGRVDNYRLNPTDYTLVEILLSGGLAHDLFRGYGRVPAPSIVAMGRDAVVVDDDALANMTTKGSKATPSLANVRYLRRVDEVLGANHPSSHSRKPKRPDSIMGLWLHQGKAWLGRTTPKDTLDSTPPHRD